MRKAVSEPEKTESGASSTGTSKLVVAHQTIMAGVMSRLCALWQLAMKPGAVWWLMPATLLWLGWLSWPRSLHIPDEGRYVGVAWDMVRFHGDFTPLLNGLPYFHKPPLFYWLNEVSFLFFGAQEWAARLPSVLVSWFAAMALYLFVRRHRGVKVATVTLLALVTMPYYYGASQYANLDMLVAALITLTILAGAEAVSRAHSGQTLHRVFAVAMGVLAALAVLSKGLIGIALPAGVLFFWLLATRRWQGFGVLLAPWVWIGFAVVGLPWFIAMEIAWPGFLHYFFVYQHFERYLSDGFNQQQPFWFFLPVVFGMSLPWSAWLLRYIWQRGEVARDASWFWLMVIWMAVILVFFSIPASKLIGYTVPVLPALAVLVAEAVVGSWRRLGVSEGQLSRDLRLTAYTAMIAVVSCLLALVIFLFANHRSSEAAIDHMRSQLTADDQFVMLDVYPFDLAFYTQNPKHTWVVFDWSTLPEGDTWRNELAEAGRFKPALAKEILINRTDLLPRLCAGPNRTYWFAAYPHERDRWDFLSDDKAFFTKRDGVTFWKKPVDKGFRDKWCKETTK